MAEQIRFRPAAAKDFRPETELELERLEGRLAEINGLLDELYDNGIIRWLKDFSGAMPEIAAILTFSLNNPQGHAGMRNLLVLAKQLGRIDPDQLERLFDSAQAGVAAAERTVEHDDSAYNPPGVTGAAKLLYDRELWAALAPLLESAKAFSKARETSAARDGDTPADD